jgi:hypothetical protein
LRSGKFCLEQATHTPLIPLHWKATRKGKKQAVCSIFLKITDYFLLQEVGYGITKETTFTLTNPQKESA